MSVLQPLPLMCQEKKKQKITKTKQSGQGQRHHNIGVHSLYHGIFTTFQHHNVHSYSFNKKELIVSLLTNRRFEDNVGEDGLSAQSSYTIDINDSNYIDNLVPDPAMFDNEVFLGHDTPKKTIPS
jgi:hypothetical protein